MCGPHHYLGRGAFAPDSAIVCLLLQRDQNASVVGQRRTDLSPGSAGRKPKNVPHPRRTPSPLLQSLGSRYTHYQIRSKIGIRFCTDGCKRAQRQSAAGIGRDAIADQPGAARYAAQRQVQPRTANEKRPPMIRRGNCFSSGSTNRRFASRRERRARASQELFSTVEFSHHHPLRRARKTGSAGAFCVLRLSARIMPVCGPPPALHVCLPQRGIRLILRTRRVRLLK